MVRSVVGQWALFGGDDFGAQVGQYADGRVRGEFDAREMMRAGDDVERLGRPSDPRIGLRPAETSTRRPDSTIGLVSRVRLPGDRPTRRDNSARDKGPSSRISSAT